MRKENSFIAWLLSLLIFLYAVPAMALAAEHTGEPEEPAIVTEQTLADQATGKQTIIWKLDSQGLLTVSGSGEMPDYAFCEPEKDDEPIFAPVNTENAAAETGIEPTAAEETGSTEPQHNVPWADYKTSIRKVHIEEGISGVGRDSFTQYTQITEVKIADSVKKIGENAFAGCTGLASVTVPSETQIGQEAFGSCISDFVIFGYHGSPAESYAQKEGITFSMLDGHSYDAPSFAWSQDRTACTAEFSCIYCTNKETRSCSVSKTDTKAECEKAGNVSYTASVALEGKTYTDRSLESIPAKGHCYGSPVFQWGKGCLTCTAVFTCMQCTSRKSIPCTVAALQGKDECTYKATAALNGKIYKDTVNEKNHPVQKGEKIKDSKTSAEYVVTDKKKDGGTVEYRRPLDKNTERVTIPAFIKVDGQKWKVTSIAQNALKDRTSVKNVVIGKNVTKIGNRAFQNCKNIVKVTIPKNVKKIGKNAFANCRKMKDIVIRTEKLNIRNVKNGAFKGIGKKATVKVPEKKKDVYKKLLQKKGAGKNIKIDTIKK